MIECDYIFKEVKENFNIINHFLKISVLRK